MAIFQNRGRALGRQRALHEIVLADRGAAGGHQHIGPGGALGQRSQIVGIVEGDAELQGNPAAGGDQRPNASPFELTIWLGPTGSPGMTTSSPVANMAMRGRRRTLNRGGPLPRRARHRGRQHSSGGEPAIAGPEIEPFGPDIVAGSGALRTVTQSPARVVSSW